MSGQISAGATARVTLVYKARVRRRRPRAAGRTVRINRGRFRATIKLGARARRARRGTLEVRYAGDATYAARRVARVVVAR